MSHYDRRHLRYFVAVAEELHFGNAARRLHISQPPLSQQIAALEEDLGTQLLFRTKRKVELTPAGQEFLKDAQRILVEIDKAASRARAVAAGQTGVLRFGLNYSAPINPQLSAIFRRYAKTYPDVRLELHENTSAKQLDGLYQHKLDICFVWPTREDASPELSFVPISKDELRLIAAEESKLARKREIKAADLKGQQIFLTLRQTRTPFYEALLAACRKEGFEPDLYTDVIQLPFIMNIVATGQGISFIPNFFERIKPEGTHFRKYNFLPASACIMPLSIGYRAHDPSPLVQNFVNIARKASNP